MGEGGGGGGGRGDGGVERGKTEVVRGRGGGKREGGRRRKTGAGNGGREESVERREVGRECSAPTRSPPVTACLQVVLSGSGSGQGRCGEDL